MRAALILIRNRLDRMGVLLSGLCALHCLLGLVLVAGLGLGGEMLFAPEIHRIGLALAYDRSRTGRPGREASGGRESG